jgi:hypothetical protein
MSPDEIEPLWLSPAKWGRKFGYSRATTYKLAAEGKIDMRKVGPTKNLVSVASGHALNESLPKATVQPPKPRDPHA